jgi:arylsulfatase A-like enzyme
VQTKEDPFFLYLHFMDVHEYAAPPEFKTFGTDSAGSYLSAIRWTDDVIERVRKKLNSKGLLDNTIMVFTSDHGETFGEHKVHGHARNVLTPVLNVPLVIRLPFPTEPIRVSSQVRNLDIAPTLLDLLSIEIPEGFQGESLLPFVESEILGNSEPDRISFAALGQPLFRDASIQVSVNDGDWTFARNVDPDPKPGEFLFDRTVDPVENVNLIEIEKKQAERMRALLDSHLSEKTMEEVLDSDVVIDPDIEKRLRALGYLE